MVSVVMIAYNVERYVEQAVNSVLTQDVDFEYELVIGEDCSNDRTREILSGCRDRYPHRIRLLTRERNLGMNENFVTTLETCRSPYIALLDGDDYWMSPQKLRRQVAALVQTPRLAAVFHNSLVIYEDDDVTPHPFHVQKPARVHERRVPRNESTLDDLITGNFIQTGSVVFRTGPCRELRQWIRSFPTFDWPLHILNAEQGTVGYLDEVWSAYRVRKEGVWSMSMSRYDRADDLLTFVQAYEFLARRFGSRFHPQIRERLASFHFRLAELRAREGDPTAAVTHARTALGMLPLRYRLTRKYLSRQRILLRILAHAGR